VTALLILAALGGGFVAGALFEHLRRDGSRDLADRLADRDYLNRVKALRLIEGGMNEGREAL
jgi:hypothetical protein